VQPAAIVANTDLAFGLRGGGKRLFSQYANIAVKRRIKGANTGKEGVSHFDRGELASGDEAA
jgi:hypothetical protein